MRLGSRTLVRSGFGIAVSIVAGWLVLRSVDLASVAEVLGSADPRWIVVMLVAVLIDVAARGGRWQVLLRPIAVIPYRRVLGFTYLGYLANNVLPARLGELVRVHALGEREGLSRTTVLGTVVVERVIDTVMVVSIAAGSVVILSARGLMTSAVLLGFAFMTLLLVGLGLAVAAHRLPGAARAAAFLERWPRIVELGRRLHDGLSVVSRPRIVAGALVFSTVSWAASIITFLAGGQAVGIELTLAQGALICSGVALVTIVPSAPGYLGTFEFTAVEIAAGLGIDRNSAFAMALLVHVAILGVTSIGGIIAASRLGVGFAGATDPLVGSDDGAPTAAA